MSVLTSLKKWTFSHGVHPDDAKNLNKDKSLERIDLPSTILLSLSQGFGAPSTPVKNVGDEVKRGELVASPSSAMGNYIYAPVDGVIKESKNFTLPSGVNAPCFVIEVTSQDSYKSDKYVPLNGSTNEELIKNAGIVGMGGAGFPLNIKYGVKDKTVDYFIVNAAECEPYLCADYRLLKEKIKECIKGIKIASDIVKAKNVFLAIEDNKIDVIPSVESALSEENLADRIQIKVMVTKYPQGDEKNLIVSLTKREVPSGKLPLDVGCVVSNLGTCFAVYEAVCLKKPLIERVVSVTGEALKSCHNYILPLGVKVNDIIERCGGFNVQPTKMISGGPMMGFAFYDTDTPVTKTTSGLTFIVDNEKRVQKPCISCGRCVNACPINLQPTRLFKLIEKEDYKKAVEENLLDCRECGCCEFSCPANINLVQGFKLGKKMWRSKK